MASRPVFIVDPDIIFIVITRRHIVLSHHFNWLITILLVQVLCNEETILLHSSTAGPLTGILSHLCLLGIRILVALGELVRLFTIFWFVLQHGLVVLDGQRLSS